ncbi:MAG: hypothetical protein H6Q65_1168 [Firmicutes bacterium]|nr:hypothetical protein [Bacillota bacterium]
MKAVENDRAPKSVSVGQKVVDTKPPAKEPGIEIRFLAAGGFLRNEEVLFVKNQ